MIEIRTASVPAAPVEPEVPVESTRATPASVDAVNAPRASAGHSSVPLGFHAVRSSSHIARLPSSQAAELMHRRAHIGVDKLRSLPHTTSDAPKVLASAPAAPPCLSCTMAQIKRTKHSSTLSAPAPEPGRLHYDLKELVLSVNGYRYVVFLIDEYARHVFYDFIAKLYPGRFTSIGEFQAAKTAYNKFVEYGQTDGSQVLQDLKAWAQASVVWTDRRMKSSVFFRKVIKPPPSNLR